ncbi:MAG TPA: D-alanine--D-alanine ligase [Spirochaetia bacterium]|nr:D-alanine--D-alanine ligase [Spirochaetia bacterium]
MIIGMTYDLRSDYLREGFSPEETAEFDSDRTIEAIDEAIRKLGFETDRIGNIRALTKRLAAGERWDLVCNLCEGLYGTARESQVPALLDAFRIPYTMSDPAVLAVTLRKDLAKLVVRNAGIPTADFVVVNSVGEVSLVDLPFPLFAKPIGEGTGKGIDRTSRVESARELSARCTDLLSDFGQPVLVETYLPGREFTVGIAGSRGSARVLGSMEVIFDSRDEGDIYGYLNKEQSEQRMSYRPGRDRTARDAEDVALRSYLALGCLDVSRVDIRFDADGRPCFMEVNPLPGLHPEHSDLPMLCAFNGIDFGSLIRIIIEEALLRSAGRAASGKEVTRE